VPSMGRERKTMDCERALQELSQYLDRELDAGASEEIARHLAECRECFSLSEFERRLRSLVRRACESVTIPPTLRQRLTDLVESF
jgi:anti-sigma factor (TIGR02949 family)